ncbi:MAG: alpha/beta fold hydrolase [Planctomycetes bacterium]|nr:alpha/beta fold hydrolase [Planctomycetota bacterium]
MTQILREETRVRTPHRTLHVELAYPADAEPAFAALVIGPHPYMGGTMQNVLVATIADEIAQAGGVSLRFDYGGAGRSEGAPVDVAASMAEFWRTGHAPEDAARADDADAAFRDLRSLGVRPVFIVGYSFGAFLAWRIGQRDGANVAGLVLVSPTLTRHTFERSDQASAAPILVIHSRDDFCTPEQAVTEWVRSLEPSTRLSCHAGGNHFFRGGERAIGQEAAAFIIAHANLSTECAAC